MAYGLEFEYLQPLDGGRLAPSVSFEALAASAGEQLEGILTPIAGIPDALTAADADNGQTISALELEALAHHNRLDVLDAGLQQLADNGIDDQFGPGDAAIDAAGTQLGILQQTPKPTSSPGDEPDLPDPGDPNLPGHQI
jgi:hypothetical protein